MDTGIYFFEINLIKELGYDTNLGEHLNIIHHEKEFTKIKIDGYLYEIPNYLISKKMPENYSNFLVRKSLYFTRQVMQNKFLFQTIYCFLNLELSLKIILIKILAF